MAKSAGNPVIRCLNFTALIELGIVVDTAVAGSQHICAHYIRKMKNPGGR
jgi:hypothetical protein